MTGTENSTATTGDQKPVVAPEGWRLVPTEPTIGMLKGLVASWSPEAKADIALWAAGTFREDYQAMLAAAPTLSEHQSDDSSETRKKLSPIQTTNKSP